MRNSCDKQQKLLFRINQKLTKQTLLIFSWLGNLFNENQTFFKLTNSGQFLVKFLGATLFIIKIHQNISARF